MNLGLLKLLRYSERHGAKENETSRHGFDRRLLDMKIARILNYVFVRFRSDTFTTTQLLIW